MDSTLPPLRHAIICRRWNSSNVFLWALRRVANAIDAGFIYTRLTVQEATLFYWTPARSAWKRSTIGTIGSSIAAAVGPRRCQVRNVFWKWMLATNGGNAAFGGFAGFREGIIAGIEVFALLMMVILTDGHGVYRMKG